MFYSLKTALCYNKIIPEEQDKKLTMQSWIFDHQACFLEASSFTDIIKELVIGFSSLYQKGLSKIYPAGTRRPGDILLRSPKGPNVRDIQGTFRGLLGDQQKNW